MTPTNIKKACLIFAASVFFISCSKDVSVAPEEQLAIYEEIDTTQYSAIEKEMLKLLNEHRASIGLPALKTSAVASKIIYDHNMYMMDQGKISHDNFTERANMLKKEEKALRVGENVASGDQTAKAVVEGLLNSEGHRKNIEGNYTHIGIAITVSKTNRMYFGQLFYRK